jgi:2,3,4,5-tetrahydropyridine-2-carboxylate N-succinyltransferase
MVRPICSRTSHNGNSMKSTAPHADLQAAVEAAWERRAELTPATHGVDRDAVEAALDLLDSGAARVAAPSETGWVVHQWLKQAVLLSFRLYPNTPLPGSLPAYDKVALKFAGWDEAKFAAAGMRAVPGAIIRRSAFISPGVVLMPCFVNVGARVGEGTMIDTWSTVGSCAQVGKNCHISGGVGLGGVLEPLQANPVVIEDDCFIGARSEVAEGVIVEQGAVLSMGVFLGASTKIIDRETGEIFTGRVPAFSVVVPGSLPGKTLPDGTAGPSLACAVIVKRVDAQTRAKTSINDLLRA